MKRSLAVIFVGALSVASGAAAAQAPAGSLNQFPQRLLPVLVQVDTQGKVTSAQPAVTLEPSLNKLLARNLDEMITAPADSHGRAVASQFISYLALQVDPRSDGNYDAHFVSVSTQPVPAGNWHWVNLDGHRLALSGPNGGRVFEHEPPATMPPSFSPNKTAPSMPPIQAAPSSVSVASAATHGH